MLGTAKLYPFSRKVPNLNEKISKLETYATQEGVKFIDFEQEVGNKLWEQHWKNWDLVLGEMQKAQKYADQLKEKLAKLSAKDNYEEKGLLGKFMGWPINDRATTIKEYHSYVSLLVKENEAMKASKPSKK